MFLKRRKKILTTKIYGENKLVSGYNYHETHFNVSQQPMFCSFDENAKLFLRHWAFLLRTQNSKSSLYRNIRVGSVVIYISMTGFCVLVYLLLFEVRALFDFIANLMMVNNRHKIYFSMQSNIVLFTRIS